jgi:hypothetical protein
MLLSDLIEDLNKVLKEKGDKEICICRKYCRVNASCW